jgi:hypothetical protein
VAQFYFHVHDSIEAPDEEGRQLLDVRAALMVAIEGARALAAEQVTKGHLHLDHRIYVENEHHENVATVTFREVVRIVD